jgi:hypothetical protein
MMATALGGSVLPYGQMSLGGLYLKPKMLNLYLYLIFIFIFVLISPVYETVSYKVSRLKGI